MSDEGSAGVNLRELVETVGGSKKPEGPQEPVHKPIWSEIISSIVDLFKVVAIVLGVYLSINTFAYTSQKDSDARLVEACKPLQALRQKLYTDTMQQAEILANPDGATGEVAKAKTRFRQLYVVELSMVETPEVETAMVQFAARVDKDLLSLSDSQKAALNLAHALGASYSAGCPARQ